MILKYQKFLESHSMIPSVGEVKDYFTEIVQDFCDMNQGDVKFDLQFNNWLHTAKDDDDIVWVSVTIKCDTTIENQKPPFTTEDIFPTISKLLDWSIKNGCIIDEYGFKDWRGNRLIMTNSDKEGVVVSYVQEEGIRNPGNFQVVGKRYQYHTIIYWR